MLKKIKISRIIIILFPIVAISSIFLFKMSIGGDWYMFFRQLILEYPIRIIPFSFIILIILRVIKIIRTMELMIYLLYYGVAELIMFLYVVRLV